MLYLVEAHPSLEQGDRVDSGDGPGPMFARIVERFRPEGFYGNPTRRQIFLIVDLAGEADIAELMYILTWWTKTEPSFTPIMKPETYGGVIANAKRITSP
jgi:hypothetical protein